MVPTLAADSVYQECLAGLEAQQFRDFECVLVDNSGEDKVRREGAAAPWLRVIAEERNVGFGAAVNHAIRASAAPLIATLNDDAVPSPRWLSALVEAIEKEPSAGMCASRIVLSGENRLDSAGMLLGGDASSKQRGHLAPLDEFRTPEEVFFPSACAALYRRAMLDAIGCFDEDFFLYCEDTDLGLRGRWAGWKCLYVPQARVAHRYSASAGVASPLKAWLVERNRLRLVVRNFPFFLIFASFFWATARYFWHVVDLFFGHGKASEFRRREGSIWRLPWLVLKAHADLLRHLPALLEQRRAIVRRRRIRPRDFRDLLKRFSMPVRQVASW